MKLFWGKIHNWISKTSNFVRLKIAIEAENLVLIMHGNVLVRMRLDYSLLLKWSFFNLV